MTAPYMPQQIDPMHVLQILDEIRARKLGLQLDQARLAESHNQFQASLSQHAEELSQRQAEFGLQQDSTIFQQVEAKLRDFALETGDQRQAERGILEALGWNPSRITAVMGYAEHSPESAPAAQNAATVATSREQTAVSDAMTGQFQNFSPEEIHRLAAAHFSHELAGATPDQVEIGQALHGGVDSHGRPLIPQVAAIAGGLMPSAGQAGQLGLGYDQLRGELMKDDNTLLAEMSRIRAQYGGLSADQRSMAYERMATLLTKMQGSQSAPETAGLVDLWNRMAQNTGDTDMIWNDPSRAPDTQSLTTKLKQRMGMTAPPPYGEPVGPGYTPPTGVPAPSMYPGTPYQPYRPRP